jgi:hypothetical protein
MANVLWAQRRMEATHKPLIAEAMEATDKPLIAKSMEAI